MINSIYELMRSCGYGHEDAKETELQIMGDRYTYGVDLIRDMAIGYFKEFGFYEQDFYREIFRAFVKVGRLLNSITNEKTQ